MLDQVQKMLLSDGDVASLLDVPLTTVRWWRLTGQLRFIRCGRHPRVARADLERFLAERASDATQPATGASRRP